MSLTRENQLRTPGEGMTGTPTQIEWAEQIKRRVSAEFDRVANALKEAAGSRSPQDRMDTGANHRDPAREAR
jgi:hypothetical protein